MEELYEKFEQIIKEEKAQIPDKQGFLYRLIYAVEDYFKQTGKQGGDSTKRKHPNHHREAGRRSAEKRWGKKE